MISTEDIRLKIIRFLNVNNLSNSNFADTIEVPRSNISHIISGRNKPSLELILKMKKAYPLLNLTWILEDKGDMFTIIKEIEEKKTPIDLFSDLKNNEESVKKTKKSSTYFSPSLPTGQNTLKKKLIRSVLYFDDGSFESYEKEKTMKETP